MYEELSLLDVLIFPCTFDGKKGGESEKKKNRINFLEKWGDCTKEEMVLVQSLVCIFFFHQC